MIYLYPVQKKFTYPEGGRELLSTLPDAFFEHGFKDDIRMIVHNGKALGMMGYTIKGGKALLSVHMRRDISYEDSVRALGAVTEHVTRACHPEVIDTVYTGCVSPLVLQANRYFAKGKNWKRVTEDWRPLLKDSVFDYEGYIINQGLMKDIPFGWFDTGAKGCGWISAFNLLKMAGDERTMEEVEKGLDKWDGAGHLLGMNISLLHFWLYRQGLKLKRSIPSDTLCAKAMHKSSCGILLYTHKRGAHFTAYRMEGDKAHFYNAVYGKSDHIETPEEFLKNHSLFHVSSVIYLEKV